MVTEQIKKLVSKAVSDSFRLDGKPLPCDQIDKQQTRMVLYDTLIKMASCEEEKKALYKTYEISRLIHIKHPDVIERNSWMIKKEA